MTDASLVQLLRHLRFTAGLLPRVIEQLASLAQVVDVPAGNVIFREGAEARDVFIVASGRIALEMNVSGRGAVRILTLGDGDLLGWSALLGGLHMTASAIALEPSRLVALPGRRLRELCEADHELGYHVMRQLAAALSRRLVGTRVQLLDLFAPPGTAQTPRA
jgi:CRP-like cAMP-binding protein